MPPIYDNKTSGCFFRNGAWTIETATQDLDQLAVDARVKRNMLLSVSDWTQLSDTPHAAEQRAAWSDYRQALRDVTAQSTFPITIIWPTAP